MISVHGPKALVILNLSKHSSFLVYYIVEFIIAIDSVQFGIKSQYSIALRTREALMKKKAKQCSQLAAQRSLRLDKNPNHELEICPKFFHNA